MTKTVIVTGSNGGIGTAICSVLRRQGYRIVGIDCVGDRNQLDAFVEFDLRQLATHPKNREAFSAALLSTVAAGSVYALVNNAAVQILGGLEDLDIEDFRATMDTNLVAPIVLAKILFDQLKQNKGSIVNIGSIHARLTKPGFVSYATSKAAILGLTQALAVDCGRRVRVNAVQPAATETPMLISGFQDQPEALELLKSYHPTNSLASPDEVARAVLFLISDENPFLNGAVLDINGGIGNRLHDPV